MLRRGQSLSQQETNRGSKSTAQNNIEHTHSFQKETRHLGNVLRCRYAGCRGTHCSKKENLPTGKPQTKGCTRDMSSMSPTPVSLPACRDAKTPCMSSNVGLWSGSNAQHRHSSRYTWAVHEGGCGWMSAPVTNAITFGLLVMPGYGVAPSV